MTGSSNCRASLRWAMRFVDWLAENDPDKVDPVIDIAITPNRPDALGVRGIARDLAARGLGVLKPYEVEPVPGGFASPDRGDDRRGCEGERLSAVRRAGHPRREERAKPRMAAGAAAGDRAAADLGAGRYHQLLHL